MRFRTKPVSPAEMCLERSPYYRARLRHLQATSPNALAGMMRRGELKAHLLSVAAAAETAEMELIRGHSLTEDQAREIVMADVASPPDPPVDERPEGLDREVEQWIRQDHLTPPHYIPFPDE
jgi:hypothetical protein